PGAAPPRRGGARLVRRVPRQLRRRTGGFLRGEPMSQTTIAKAINSGLRAAMENDPKVLIMGEDVGKLGGVFWATDGLQKAFGEGIGAVEHHSESPEAYFAHTAGLRIVSCSNPADAYWMIQQAITSDDPVLSFEPKRRYWEKGELDPSAGPETGLHEARVVR